MYQPYRPESLGCTYQKAEHVDFLLLFFFRDAVVFGIELGRIFLYLQRGVNNAKDKDGRADVEGVDDRIWYHPLGRDVADAYGREDEREEVTRQASGVAQETLYGIGQPLLFLVHQVAYHHLEGLHGHVDACVQQHQ